MIDLMGLDSLSGPTQGQVSAGAEFFTTYKYFPSYRVSYNCANTTGSDSLKASNIRDQTVATK